MTVFVILALTLMLAFYVAAEFAAVSVRESRVRPRAGEGSALAKRLLHVLSDSHRLDNYIAASQIGITISGLVAGAYAQPRLPPVLMPWFERLGGMQQAAASSAAAITVLVVLTIVQMVFGEVQHAFAQTRVPSAVASDPAGIATGALDLLNLSAGHAFDFAGKRHELTFRGDNVLDERYREASSRLKGFAFNPGRNFALGYRTTF